jgi:hypothetical protein
MSQRSERTMYTVPFRSAHVSERSERTMYTVPFHSAHVSASRRVRQ